MLPSRICIPRVQSKPPCWRDRSAAALPAPAWIPKGRGHRQAVTSPRGVVGRRSLYSGKRSKTAVGVGHMWRPCERHWMKFEGVSIFSLPHRKACAARLFPPKAKDDRILTEMRAGHDVRRVEKRGTCLRKWRSLHLLRQIGGGCFRTSTDASAPIERVS